MLGYRHCELDFARIAVEVKSTAQTGDGLPQLVQRQRGRLGAAQAKKDRGRIGIRRPCIDLLRFDNV